MLANCFHPFQSDITQFELPEKFTFPFAYEPLPLTEVAVKEVQAILDQVDTSQQIAGKMFGVLVVQNADQQLGYLIAYSGQLGGETYPINFVPSVYDRLAVDGFFKAGEKELIQINQTIEELQTAPEFVALLSDLETAQQQAEQEISASLARKQAAKKDRAKQREEGQKQLSQEAYQQLDHRLKSESTNIHYDHKHLRNAWKEKTEAIQGKIDQHKQEIESLRKQRKAKSNDLQQQIFDQYQFLNQYGKTKALTDVFADLPAPPAGAGDCAAPKLLQYAFKHQLKPVTMAEFWWGKTPKSAIRHQGKYYPACHSRCRPILKHMLEGMPLDDDPLKEYDPAKQRIETVFEDDHLLVINKPAGLLSVPSKEINDSVMIRIQKEYPEATLVHRLDQLTSGLLIIAKSMPVYKVMQKQFLDKTIQKTYLAILDGEIKGSHGYIDLPLVADDERKPLQRVCHQTGKPSQTTWRVIGIENGRTRIKFRPITGRTHQLRVHAAHQEGLGTPIVGDVLYGKKDTRLMLQARALEFIHPVEKRTIRLQVKADF